MAVIPSLQIEERWLTNICTNQQGVEAIHQLLTRPQAYRIIIGARDVPRARETYTKREYDSQANNLNILQLDLADMKQVKTFARETLETVGKGNIDYLLLNAGITNPVEDKNRFGSKWCEQYIVNHLCLSPNYLSCGRTIGHLTMK